MSIRSVAALVASAALLGAHAEAAERTCTVALFDASHSTNKELVRKNYRKGFQAVLDSVVKGEGSDQVLVGESITDDTLGTASRPIDLELKREVDNRLIRKRAVAEAEKTSEALILRSQPTATTDLLNAMRFAESEFSAERCGPSAAKVLILFSDMVHDSAEPHRFDRDPLEEPAAKKLVDRLAKEGSIAKLQGVKVYVAGLRQSTLKLPDARWRQIEAFWKLYFAAAKAEVASMGSLLRYP